LASKPLKCAFCDKKYNTKIPLYNHVEQKHGDLIPHNISVEQYLFNVKYNKTSGSCIMCKRETEWNEKSEKYERLCTRPKCANDFREMFKKRMMKVHGKVHLLNDAEVQKKMLASRKISGTYTWHNGHKTNYVGSYEKNFLEFMETMGWENPEGILMPAPFVLKYQYEDKEHFYIPDVFIQSLNLVIEIKASAKNNTHHFRQREQATEKIKDDITKRAGYNYIKVEDNNFKELTEFLNKD